MEVLAQFFKNAFFLLLVMRIAVIVVLLVFIYRTLKTPFMIDMFRRLFSNGRRSYPGEKSPL